MIYKFLQDNGYDISESPMKKYISEWGSWWKGKVAKFHSYTVHNGKKRVKCERYSLQLGKTVCETWASLLFNEKCKITIDDEDTQDFVYKVFNDNNFWVMINEMQEIKAALGTVCYIPYAKGVAADSNGNISQADGIAMNYVTADNMIPLSWENGVITELAVVNGYTVKKEKYLYIQLFLIGKDGNYDIQNRIIQKKGSSYTELSLSEVSGFEKIAPAIKTGSNIKPFIIDRFNIANNIDKGSPFGVAVFANAIDSIKMCDIAFDSYVNEYVLGKRRIMVAEEAVKIIDGEPAFDENDVVFYCLPKSGTNLEDKPFVKEMQAEIRADAHKQGLTQGLNIFSSQCGLGENYYRFNESNIATATQVISENNTMFRTLKKHEIILDAVLTDLVRLIIYIGVNTLHKSLKSDAEIKIQFDDSIIEDKETEMKRDLLLVQNAIMSREEWRITHKNETPEQAKTAVEHIDSQITDDLFDNESYSAEE